MAYQGNQRILALERMPGMISEKFEIAAALDREIETEWGVIAALQWIL